MAVLTGAPAGCGPAVVSSAMVSTLIIEASVRRGVTVLHRMAATGQLVARQTGPESVHLVSVAAGPLNGDTLEVRVSLGPEARLAIGTTAATIALPAAGGPGRQRPSRITVHGRLDEGAQLHWLPEPTVVADGAVLEVSAEFEVADSAALHFRETLVLGRHGEVGGWAVSRLRVRRDGRPALSQTLDSAVLDRTGRWTGAPERVVAGEALVGAPAARGRSVATGAAVAMLVEPGLLLGTAVGPDAAATTAAVAAVLAEARHQG